MKFEAREIFAILVVFLLPLGMGQFVTKSTLPGYGAALQIRSALAGADAQPHIAVAAALEGAYASIMGLGTATPQAIVGFLLIFPPLLLALSSVMLYFACRQLQYSKAPSAFAALLFSLSLTAFLSFLPGVYGSGQLAALLFAAFLVPFAAFVHKPSRIEMLGAAAVLGFAAGYVNAVFALAGIAAVVAFAFAHHKKKEEKNYLAMLGALALVLAAAIFLSADTSMLWFSQESLAEIATGAPNLFSASAICIGLFFFGTHDSEFLALVLFGAALFGFSPLAGAMLLVLPVAEGITKVVGNASKGAKLTAAFLCAFFVVAGIIYPQAGPYPAMAAGAMLGLLAPLTLHLYDYNARGFFAVAGASILLLSVFFAAFVQLPPVKQGFPLYTSPGLSESLEYLSEEGAPGLATLDRIDAIGFYLPSASIGNKNKLEKFLSSGNESLEPGTILLLSLPSLETLSEKGGFEVYYYAQNYTNADVTFALFVSSQGRLVSREIASGGSFALKDGAALDSFGRYYAPVTVPRMVMLSGSKPYSDKSNRLLVLEEGSLPPKVAGIYSGADTSATLLKEFDDVSVYRVN